MSAPDKADWEVPGERPTRSGQPDRAGLLMVGLVLVNLLAALVVLILL